MATTDAPEPIVSVQTPVNPPTSSDVDDDALLNAIPVPAPKAADPAPAQAAPEAPASPVEVPAAVDQPDNGDTPDKAAKRNIEAAEKSDSWLIKNIVPIMAILVTVLSFLFFFYVLKYMDFTKDPAKKDIAVYLMGTVSALEVGIVGYYFGSSKGSHDKGMTIDRQLKKIN